MEPGPSRHTTLHPQHQPCIVSSGLSVGHVAASPPSTPPLQALGSYAQRRPRAHWRGRPPDGPETRLPQKRQLTSSSTDSSDDPVRQQWAAIKVMADASNTWRTGGPGITSTMGGQGESSTTNRSRGRRKPGRAGRNAKTAAAEKRISIAQTVQSVPPPDVESQPKQRKKKKGKAAAELASLPLLPGALHTMDYLTNALYNVALDSGKVKKAWVENPKNALSAYFARQYGEPPTYSHQEGRLEEGVEKSFRATVDGDRELGITGYGDGRSRKDAERCAAFDAVMQLAERGLLDRKPAPALEGDLSAAAASGGAAKEQVKLSTGATLTAERAREFMDFYCREFKFGKPIIEHTQVPASGRPGKGKSKSQNQSWQADMIVGNVSVGKGTGSSKKTATTNCYIDTVVFIESSDRDLYARFDNSHKPGAPMTAAAHVYFRLNEHVNEDIREVVHQSRRSLLYSKRPRPAGSVQPGDAAEADSQPQQKRRVDVVRMPRQEYMESKSQELMSRLQSYQTDDRVADMRDFRNLLPVAQNVTDILTKVAMHQVSICMAATGSGKSTQVPQILLDDAILEGKGAYCNIICTQPRRIAAISLAQRVASERGEQIGDSVGYQVRFEQKLPKPHGSITYCTTGSFMRRLQNALGDDSTDLTTWLDTITHVVIDEVHERDVQTDLLLVVLKKVLAQRKAAGKRDVKLILMSATVDPKLFQSYFPDQFGRPAPVVEIPGRAFPVTRHFMEEYIPQLQSLNLPAAAGGWVWQQKNVQEYLHRELQMRGGIKQGEEGAEVIDDLEIPYPLVSLYIADALRKGEDGHVLVFMPGWDDIKSILNIIQNTSQFPLLGINFTDSSRYQIHILHSSVPVADQQAVFSPPPKGVRRIILATNIAETSVTIPDVTVVIDTGRVKEMRYDPNRHLSSLVSAWVGTSNLSQRAGRAGRHRSGDYYGVLSKARHDRLAIHQTVEMQRAELSDVVLHIKALNITGMEPEEVLASAIEPPSPDRVHAAMEQLFMIGALDQDKALTSLGALLLQLPVDAAMGKMILYGLFFRCLEPALALAAILTTRDPFLGSIDLKTQVSQVKESWSPSDYRSDALATLRAYQAFTQIHASGNWSASLRFCNENYLSRNTLLDIQRLAKHLAQSVQGMIEVVLGTDRHDETPRFRPRGMRVSESAPELNENSTCTPLLAALIAMASQPNFAIRKSEKFYQTSQDKATFLSGGSVCHPKHLKGKEDEVNATGEKELYAFAEKSRNISQLGSGGGSGMTMLRTVTKLDPLTYMLFGTHRIRGTQDGVICDDWLPVRGYFAALDDVEALKHVMDASMLRVFEGIGHSRNRNQSQNGRSANGTSATHGKTGPANGESWDPEDDGRNEDGPDDSVPVHGDRSDLTLTQPEVEEFKYLIQGIVRLLEEYAHDRASMASSTNSTRPSSPGVGLNLSHLGFGSSGGQAGLYKNWGSGSFGPGAGPQGNRHDSSSPAQGTAHAPVYSSGGRQGGAYPPLMPQAGPTSGYASPSNGFGHQSGPPAASTRGSGPATSTSWKDWA